jgi:hypothetical protein
MTIMATNTANPWQTDRGWQIVRADLDLAHVFLPLGRFNFALGKNADGHPGYTVTHASVLPDCFEKTFLVEAGSSQPTFKQIANRDTLPKFETRYADDYKTVSEMMEKHMQKDRDVKRLEGTIKVPCHAHGAALKTEALAGHAPMWIKTLIHVYQFNDVVNGDGPLLVIRAPLSPTCPLNGDGTAVGLA